jgi:voltage-gated potassium channel
MVKPKEEWRHLALLISILILFTITPLLETFRHGALIMDLLAAGVLIAGSYALGRRKHLFAAAVALSVITTLISGILLIRHERWIAVCWLLCIVTLSVYLSVTILGYVLHSGRITTDKIFAAVCVYMLIGYAWTFSYALLDELSPTSFLALSPASAHDYVSHILQLRYFSFMTLTTVGYGDIVPRSSPARTLAALEAVTGQIYLAVLVARLVGLHIVHASDSR